MERGTAGTDHRPGQQRNTVAMGRIGEAVHNKFNCWLTRAAVTWTWAHLLLFPCFGLAKSEWTTCGFQTFILFSLEFRRFWWWWFIDTPRYRTTIPWTGWIRKGDALEKMGNVSIRFSWNRNYFSSNFMSPDWFNADDLRAPFISQWGRTSSFILWESYEPRERSSSFLILHIHIRFCFYWSVVFYSVRSR